MTEQACGALITAAGFSRRFGADKRIQLLSPNGPTVIEATIAKYRNVFTQLKVVIRAEDDHLRNLLSEVELVLATDAHLGHGHSLKAGFANNHWSYTFVALADMPYIETATLVELKRRAEAQPNVIHRPRYTGEAEHTLGHPIGFPAHVYDEMRLLSGDTGAREVVRKHEVVELATTDYGVVQDIDHPSDLD